VGPSRFLWISSPDQLIVLAAIVLKRLKCGSQGYGPLALALIGHISGPFFPRHCEQQMNISLIPWRRIPNRTTTDKQNFNNDSKGDSILSI
jgi:hypothetical protein